MITVILLLLVLLIGLFILIKSVTTKESNPSVIPAAFGLFLVITSFAWLLLLLLL